MPIEKAIQKVCSIHRHLGRYSSSRREITRAMGHSGSAHSLHIAALRAYGLIEGRADDLKLTRCATIIVEMAEEPHHPDRTRSIRLAAFTPEVFNGLQRRFGEGRVPAKAASYRWLTERGFTHRGATRVIHIEGSNFGFLDALTRKNRVIEDVAGISRHVAGSELGIEVPGAQPVTARKRIRLTIDICSAGGAAIGKELSQHHDDLASDGCEIVLREQSDQAYDVIVVRAGYSPPPDDSWTVLRQQREYRYIASFRKPSGEQLVAAVLALLAIPLIELL